MDSTGQLLSLDFLLAIGLIVLALGITLKFSEQAIFDAHERQQQTDLETTGRSAVMLLLSNPQVTCEVKAIDETLLGQQVNNCIDTAKNFNRAVLGLPADWNYNIFNSTDETSIAKTDDPYPGTEAIFSVDINAIVHNGPVSKAALSDCLKKKDWKDNPLPPCSLEQKTVWVRIWKK